MPTTNAPPTHTRCVCPACGEVFSVVGNFDRHRRGGKCLDPASVGLEVKVGAAGSWWGQPGDFWPRKGRAAILYRRAGKTPGESSRENNLAKSRPPQKPSQTD